MSMIAFCNCYKMVQKSVVSKWLAVTVICATFSLLSKEQGITVLLVCTVYHLQQKWRESHSFRENLQIAKEIFKDKRFITSLVTILVLLGLRILMLCGSMPRFSDQDNPASFSPSFLTRFLTYTYLVAVNFWLLLFPLRLSYDWQLGSISLIESFNDIRNLATLFFVTGLFIVVGKSFYVQRCERESLGLSLSVLIFSFLPATNLFTTVGFVIAERVLYIPSIGFCMVVTCGLKRIKPRGLRMVWTCRLVTCFLVALFVLRTTKRNQDWLTRESLFKSGLSTSPSNAKVHYNYANLQMDIGNKELAIKHYRIALSLWPNHASAHNNLGTLLPDKKEAEIHFKKAIQINPYHSRAYYNLAVTYSQLGKTEAALNLLRRALMLDPLFSEAYSSQAYLYSIKGENTIAECIHRNIIKLEPENANYLNNYGSFLHKLGRIEEALELYQKALKYQPNHFKALLNVARIMKTLEKTREEEIIYKRILEITEDPTVMDNLGLLYISTGRFKEGKIIYEKLRNKFSNYIYGKIHFVSQNFIFYLSKYKVLKEPFNNDKNYVYTYNKFCQWRLSMALKYISKALTLCGKSDKKCAQLYSYHGDILKDMKNLEASAQSYSTALNMDPNLSHAHINLAVIQHLQGNYSEALYHYQKAFNLEPDNNILLENMQKLKKNLLTSTKSCQMR
ncbi:transmembrane and TPR repeat-containing protein 1-like [Centruroides sculpturatus]|uniref:transmembrane and TPR repeat-containing protein 1-like n=1 Tax=Centruroides sculpturatus TaxID=218467 RepID=UPI000C6DF538|nr:transmembrane and TPR repeat-containing protein 1-like [Centruroides sculpturatus]